MTASTFAELAATSASPVVTAHLERLVAQGSDFDCYKLNAYRLAHELGVERLEALRTLLFATQLGLFDLSFDIHCPSCYGIPAYHRHLMGLRNRAHCSLCEIDWDLDFEEQVEVTFTVNPALRVLRYRDWADRDFRGKMEWLGDVLRREGRDLDVGICVQPGETARVTATLEAGTYDVYLPSHRERGGSLVAEGKAVDELRSLALRAAADGSLDLGTVVLAPGPVEFVVTSEYPSMNGFLVVSTAQRTNWVSAAQVMAQQDFRALFGGEYLAPDTSFAIRSVTLMFTDITGSTAMYERLGDGAAFTLVQEHFRVMTEVIGRHGGGIIKTIGDAVMAAFPDPVRGVRAACAIQAAFGARREPLQDVTVKIGLHSGPCIAVTSNRSTDYFGRTVNVAARVQAQSGPGEVVLSSAVAAHPGVGAWLDSAAQARRPRRAQLKGIEGDVDLVVVSPGGPSSA